jgi:hypothetical protein
MSIDSIRSGTAHCGTADEEIKHSAMQTVAAKQG